MREETGVQGDLVSHLATIEYWFQESSDGSAMRVHKRVAFYLMRYVSGDVRDHDHEVHEARWFPIGEAAGALHFRSERAVLERAQEALAGPRSRPATPSRAPRVRN